MFQTSERIYYSKYKGILFTLSYLNNQIPKPPYFRNIRSQKMIDRRGQTARRDIHKL